MRNDKRFMGAILEERNGTEEARYGFNFATTSQSAFINDNIFAGRFFIDSAITAESANTFIQNLRWYTNYQMQRAAEKRMPAMIHINTGGGEISQGFAIINAIRACPLETVGIVQGSCYSMGVPILLACNVRLSYEMSELMIHQLAGWNYGKLLDMQASMDRCNKMQERLETFMIENSNMTQDFLDEIREGKTDYFFYPDEALELGIVDEVIGDMDEYNRKKMEEMIADQMNPNGSCGDKCTCNSDENPESKKGSDDGVVITDGDFDDDGIKLEIEGEEESEILTSEEITALKKRLKRQKSKLKRAKQKVEEAEDSDAEEEAKKRVETIENKIEAIKVELEKA